MALALALAMGFHGFTGCMHIARDQRLDVVPMYASMLPDADNTCYVQQALQGTCLPAD